MTPAPKANRAGPGHTQGSYFRWSCFLSPGSYACMVFPVLLDNQFCPFLSSVLQDNRVSTSSHWGPTPASRNRPLSRPVPRVTPRSPTGTRCPQLPTPVQPQDLPTQSPRGLTVRRSSWVTTTPCPHGDLEVRSETPREATHGNDGVCGTQLP